MAEKRLKWIRWALVGSVALNLAFAGLIGGALLKGPPPAPWPGITLLKYARALPEPYRDDLRRTLRDRSHDWKGPREALRGQREALAAALTAEPFAPETVATLLERETALTQELSSRGTALLLEQIRRMSAEDRMAYAAELREPPRRGDRPPHDGEPRRR
jgi:uncharacterized membrane protein